MKSVSYATYCCKKDMDRVLGSFLSHVETHKHTFDEKFLVGQRLEKDIELFGTDFKFVPIQEQDYSSILWAFGIKYPDPVLDELTHGWGAPHFWAHHMVNHLQTLILCESDYIVFADGDCYLKESPTSHSWVEKGIKILEADPSIFVVCPNDGGPERLEKIMSQQMFLVNRKRMLEMEFIPWDGRFIEGGPFQEYYGLLEGWIGRYLAKHNLWRAVMSPEYRWWHLEWH
jgi:hypothetical protein